LWMLGSFYGQSHDSWPRRAFTLERFVLRAPF
jgi:hypothetical protein